MARWQIAFLKFGSVAEKVGHPRLKTLGRTASYIWQHCISALRQYHYSQLKISVFSYFFIVDINYSKACFTERNMIKHIQNELNLSENLKLKLLLTVVKHFKFD